MTASKAGRRILNLDSAVYEQRQAYFHCHNLSYAASGSVSIVIVGISMVDFARGSVSHLTNHPVLSFEIAASIPSSRNCIELSKHFNKWGQNLRARDVPGCSLCCLEGLL